jgi:uncharacterized repeat protein (TIGR01451 family)
MEDQTVSKFKLKKFSTLRRLGTSSLALMVFAAQVTPALATIDNTATASGTYSGTVYTATGAASVNVAAAAGSVNVTKSAGVPTTSAGVAGIVDAGDTILYTYTVTNNGNVSLTNVLPVDAGPKFGPSNLAGTGTLGAFTPAGPITLAPSPAAGSSQTYTALYTLSAVDVDRSAGIPNGVTNVATATGKTPGNVTAATNTTPTVNVTIPAGPKLQTTKSFTLATSGGVPITPNTTPVKVGDVVTYTYKVKNIGNVAMTGVTVSDLHVLTTYVSTVDMMNEKVLVGDDGPLSTATPAVASTDATINNGTWSVLQPGATVTFTWTHAVTQAEFDAG